MRKSVSLVAKVLKNNARNACRIISFLYICSRTHFTYTKNESYNPTYEQDAECKTNEKVVSQEEIDRILDKIRKSGYDSLTQSEKQMLFDQSNK